MQLDKVASLELLLDPVGVRVSDEWLWALSKGLGVSYSMTLTCAELCAI